jgi:hypothetical protein
MEVFTATRELADFQRYMLEQAGDKTKIIFITTGVPLWWTIGKERTVHPDGLNAQLLLKPVRKLVSDYVLRYQGVHVPSSDPTDAEPAAEFRHSTARSAAVAGDSFEGYCYDSVNRALATLNPFIRFIATEEIELKDIKDIGNLKNLCDGNLDLTSHAIELRILCTVVRSCLFLFMCRYF